MSYFPLAEQITDILVKKTQSRDPHFFRILVAYYMAKVASMMRCDVKTHDRGRVPVSVYVLNLAQSGFGKNFSTNIMEDHVLRAFKKAFMNSTFEELGWNNIKQLASQKCARDVNLVLDTVETSLKGEFDRLGPLAFSFDSGTVPALKQMRHKLLMANAGSICFEGDEVGSNFINNQDMLNAFLELYDIGKTKIKLIKNTTEAQRAEDIDGRTPTNLLLFGTPNKLLNGKIEAEFDGMLETGYARRLLFGYSQLNIGATGLTAQELYDDLVNANTDQELLDIEEHFHKCALPTRAHRVLPMDQAVSIAILDYKLACDEKAMKFKDHQEIHKAEMTHRYFKVIKLAGAYAFVDGATSLDQQYVDYAIQLVEDSGDAFKRIMERDRNYIRTAKYLADMGEEVTHVDIMEDVPAFRGSATQRAEILNLATAWGYKNNIIIETQVRDSVEFLRGEALQKTSLQEIQIAYSKDIVKDFAGHKVPFGQLYKLTTAADHHYTAHTFTAGYRNTDNVIPGFNLAIIDVDQGTTLEAAKLLLADYTYLISTTKRHTPTDHRFRVILPLSHYIILKPSKYSTFMQNIFNWLPFDVDEATKDIARKWESNNKAAYYYNNGKLLDATEFIPQTRKATVNKKFLDTYSSMDNLERWFINHTEEGNRSNMLVKYGFALIDAGYEIKSIQQRILEFNSKLERPLEEAEILSTIIVSVSRKFGERKL